MPRVTRDIVGAISVAALATALFVLRQPMSIRWASTLPGHALGALGISLMLWAGFGYTWRKRHPAPGGQPMRHAMTLHMAAGLLGPYLVILHSGLVFRGVAAVTTLVMVLVVASGVVGRAIITARPTHIEQGDPVRSAMLEAELARLETENADLARAGDPDPQRHDAIRREIAAVRHEQDFHRTQWQQAADVVTWRRVLSVWWYLHVPMSAGLWVLALAHVIGASYYATFSR